MSYYIQRKTNGTTGASTAITATFDAPVTTGNSVLVFIYTDTATVTSVTDGTNTYTPDFSSTVSGNIYAYRSDGVVGSAALTVSANYSSDTLPKEIIVVEYANLVSGSFDKSVSASGNTNTNPLSSGATATLSQNLELVIALATIFNGSSTMSDKTGDFGHAITVNTGSTSFPLFFADKMVNSTNAQNSSIKWGTGGLTCKVVCLTYKYNNVDPVRINVLRPAVFKPGLAR